MVGVALSTCAGGSAHRWCLLEPIHSGSIQLDHTWIFTRCCEVCVCKQSNISPLVYLGHMPQRACEVLRGWTGFSGEVELGLGAQGVLLRSGGANGGAQSGRYGLEWSDLGGQGLGDLAGGGVLDSRVITGGGTQASVRLCRGAKPRARVAFKGHEQGMTMQTMCGGMRERTFGRALDTSPSRPRGFNLFCPFVRFLPLYMPALDANTGHEFRRTWAKSFCKISSHLYIVEFVQGPRCFMS